MLIPWNTSSVYTHTPYSNWAVIGVTSVVSFWGFTILADPFGNTSAFEALMLQGWNLVGMLGHALLHGGFFHLLGNMIFLWVFGNVVCSKTGSLKYVAVYIACTLGAAACHLFLSDSAVIGASGAVNGIVGFYLVLQPTNQVEMVFIWFLRAKRFSVAGYWVILYWAIWDIYGLASSAGGIAYAAHVGGLLTGIAIRAVFVLMRWIDLDECDTPTLLEHLGFVPKGYAGGYEARNGSGKISRSAKRGASRPKKNEKIVFEQPASAPAPSPQVEESAPLPPLQPLPDQDVFSLDCPYCGKELEISLDLAGSEFTCPGCKEPICVELSDS